MTSTERSWHDAKGSRFGRAAEHFARRVARDARKFAARVEEHAGDFAHDASRSWRCSERAFGHDAHPRSVPDARRVLEDIRSVLADVLDGFDELIARVLPGATEEDWTRAVSNRDTTCGGCGRSTAAGTEGYLRRTADGVECRCLECGVPVEGPGPA